MMNLTVAWLQQFGLTTTTFSSGSSVSHRPTKHAANFARTVATAVVFIVEILFCFIEVVVFWEHEHVIIVKIIVKNINFLVKLVIIIIIISRVFVLAKVLSEGEFIKLMSLLLLRWLMWLVSTWHEPLALLHLLFLLLNHFPVAM
jgi:hypothetical protein